MSETNDRHEHRRNEEERQRLREKTVVAGLSAAAATVLTTGKLIVGLLTGSLAILSEAAHSALDLLASLITFLAVRIGSRPPDEAHPYGHQKIESIAAYTESIFLIATCTWITVEATKRLFFWETDSHRVELTPWAYAIVLVSLIVDAWRSTALARAAKKHQSQALEADALHFRADLWSSTVVLTGLTIMGLWRRFAPQWAPVLDRVDAVAALGVVLLVLTATLRLGGQTVNVLLDTASGSLVDDLRNVVEEVDGVLGIHHLRARQVGQKTFVELTVAVSRTASFEVSHEVTRKVAEAIRGLVPAADVVVHAQPARCDHETVVGRVRVLAENVGMHVHDLMVHEAGGRFYVDLDVEVDERLTVGEAHEHATALESLVRREIPEVAQVNSRIEPRPASTTGAIEVTAEREDLVRQAERIVAKVPGLSTCHNIVVREDDSRLFLTMHCVCDPDMALGDAHRAARQVEEQLYRALPNLERALVHTEPPVGARRRRKQE